MRARFLIASTLSIIVLTAVGSAAVRFADDSPVAAQSSPAPLLANEIAGWCPRTASGAVAGACDGGQYALLSDGSVHVLLDINPGSGDAISPGNCIAGIDFPDDVTGVAYVLEGDRYGVIDLSGIRPTSNVCEFVVRRKS